MCISKQELDKKIADIRSLKALKEETENELKALEYEVIDFLTETKECETVDRKGKPIRQYIGNDFKATYTEQTRETLDKETVKKLLGKEGFEKVRKESRFSVLRIS